MRTRKPSHYCPYRYSSQAQRRKRREIENHWANPMPTQWSGRPFRRSRPNPRRCGSCHRTRVPVRRRSARNWHQPRQETSSRAGCRLSSRRQGTAMWGVPEAHPVDARSSTPIATPIARLRMLAPYAQRALSSTLRTSSKTLISSPMGCGPTAQAAATAGNGGKSPGTLALLKDEREAIDRLLEERKREGGSHGGPVRRRESSSGAWEVGGGSP